KIDDIKPLLLEGRSDANVRRAASECLRGLVQRDPHGVRPVLEELRQDGDLYVKKSVANVLRNAARTQPDFVLDLRADWARSTNPHTRGIFREGLRKMKATHATSAKPILELGARTDQSLLTK